MKKFFLSAMALALIASCAKEAMPAVQGGDTMVSLTVELPKTIETKSTTETEKVSVGAETDVVYYEVWNADRTRQLYPKNADDLISAPVVDNKATIEISLVSDQTYTFIFWAQNQNCAAYDVKDLKNVAIDYNVIKKKGNDDVFDAFYKVEDITVPVTNKTITLTRPFAQLNFGASVMATDLGDIVVDSTYVTVSQLSTVFKTIEGLGDAGKVVNNVRFAAKGRVSETEGPEAATFTTNNVSYAWITMDYMLMTEASSSVEVGAMFRVEGIGDVRHTVSNVPLKKNFRTNIVGDLFTTDAVLQVVVEPGFEDDIVQSLGADVPELVGNEYHVENAEQVMWLSRQVAGFFEGKVISFDADIDMKGMTISPISASATPVAEGFDVVGNGKTISNFKVQAYGSEIYGGLFGYVVGDITGLNVKDVTVDANFTAGSLVGKITGNVKDCSAKNVKVTSVPHLVNGVFDDGNNVGGLVGYLAEGVSITGCTVDGAEVKGYRDLGALVGKAQNGNVSANMVTNSVVTVDQTYTPYNGAPKDTNAGEVVGRNLGSTVAAGQYDASTVSVTSVQ